MKNIGLLLVGVWLLLHGLISIINLHFSGLPVLMGVLAIIAGVLLIIRR
ncbi:MAG: hypothetical protein JXA04_10905 [Gammaproteobacteria bacterium]|nr:hypothetical protein [Gammaproteobacteria bacterium]